VRPQEVSKSQSSWGHKLCVIVSCDLMTSQLLRTRSQSHVTIGVVNPKVENETMS